MPRPSATAAAEIIHSRHNARLKDLRRRMLDANYANDGLIAIEGEHLLEEAQRSGLRIDTVFLREDRAGKAAGPGEPRIFVVAADAFDHACATEAPQGVAALVQTPTWSLEDLLRVEKPLLIVLAGLQDPGNVGTIIRSAEAFGAAGVLLTAGSVHPWNQKVLRASAGSSLRLPTVSLKDIAALRRLREREIPLYACAANSGVAASDHNFRCSGSFVIGNEGAGIPVEVLRYCSGAIRIPCPGPVESLNAAVAASVLLYEAARQRTPATKANKA